MPLICKSFFLKRNATRAVYRVNYYNVRKEIKKKQLYIIKFNHLLKDCQPHLEIQDFCFLFKFYCLIAK